MGDKKNMDVLSDLGRGALLAISTLLACHDVPTIAADVVFHMGLSTMDCSSLGAFDKRQLAKLTSAGIRMPGLSLPEPATDLPPTPALDPCWVVQDARTGNYASDDSQGWTSKVWRALMFGTLPQAQSWVCERLARYGHPNDALADAPPLTGAAAWLDRVLVRQHSHGSETWRFRRDQTGSWERSAPEVSNG